jgi:hypothetical protein
VGRKLSQELRDEIVYGRDHDHARIFISSRMCQTFDAERIVAADSVDQIAGHRAWFWERDAAGGVLHSEQECVKYAKASAGLILLVDGELSDIVRAEYEAARAGGANRFIFIRNGPASATAASSTVARLLLMKNSFVILITTVTNATRNQEADREGCSNGHDLFAINGESGSCALIGGVKVHRDRSRRDRSQRLSLDG